MTLYTLSARRLALLLSVVIAGLVLVHVVAMQVIFNPRLALADNLGLEYWHLSIFDLDEEESFGTWYSALLLFGTGQLLLVRGWLGRQRAEPFAGGWIGLGVIFHLLSLDEVVALHELLNSVLEDTSWTAFGVAFLAVVALVYLRFLWHHRYDAAPWLILAGAVYVGGAVGMEIVSGSDVNSLGYNMLTAVEEGMEMAGVVVLAWYLVSRLETMTGPGAAIVLARPDP